MFKIANNCFYSGNILKISTDLRRWNKRRKWIHIIMVLEGHLKKLKKNNRNKYLYVPMSKCVSRNGPKWLVAIFTSSPSSVLWNLDSAVPALCTKTSNLGSVLIMSSANSLMDFWDDKSSFFSITSSLFVLSTISSGIIYIYILYYLNLKRPLQVCSLCNLFSILLYI